MTQRKFTVIGACHCGCDQGFTMTETATSAYEAAVQALEHRQQSGTVYAVIEGWHGDRLPQPVTR